MTEESVVNPEQKYLKVPDAAWNEEEHRGGKVTVKLRLLDYPGVLVFRHWIGDGKIKRPFICPGRKNNCPACRERSIIKVKGGNYQDVYRMDARRFVNVLELSEDDPKLKIWQYGPSIEKRFTATIERGEKYADPTSYDITLMKRKTGKEPFNVEYDVFVDSHRDLTAIEKAIASQKYDIKSETKPNTPEEIEAAMKGNTVSNPLASDDLRAKAAKALKDSTLTWLDANVTDPDSLTQAKALEIINEFSS